MCFIMDVGVEVRTQCSHPLGLLTTAGSDLWIVDQHAADEKYNFERLQATTVLHRQPLVCPQVGRLRPNAQSQRTLLPAQPLHAHLFILQWCRISLLGSAVDGRQCHGGPRHQVTPHLRPGAFSRLILARHCITAALRRMLTGAVLALSTTGRSNPTKAATEWVLRRALSCEPCRAHLEAFRKNGFDFRDGPEGRLQLTAVPLSQKVGADIFHMRLP